MQLKGFNQWFKLISSSADLDFFQQVVSNLTLYISDNNRFTSTCKQPQLKVKFNHYKNKMFTDC